jgi:hypothetical protein
VCPDRSTTAVSLRTHRQLRRRGQLAIIQPKNDFGYNDDWLDFDPTATSGAVPSRLRLSPARSFVTAVCATPSRESRSGVAAVATSRTRHLLPGPANRRRPGNW